VPGSRRTFHPVLLVFLWGRPSACPIKALRRWEAAKIGLSHEEMQQRHKDLAIAFGDQPEHVKAEAKERTRDVGQESGTKIAHVAVTFARERNFERDAVADERALLTDALRR
jgi:hypothetical protein